MNRLRQAVALGVATLLAAGALYLGLSWRNEHTSATGIEPVSLSTGALYATGFPDLHGKARSLGEWQGRVIVLNFWATWCAPCREEIPVFMRVQERLRERGVTFVGLAIDDQAKVVPYARELAINYPILIGDSAASDLARRLGNASAALPYSVILDRRGDVVARQLGPLGEAELEVILGSLL